MKGGKTKEAMLMHTRRQDWEAARRVAELHCPQHLPDVLVGQVRACTHVLWSWVAIMNFCVAGVCITFG